MEIILKIKQGGNPQFKFLSFEDPLNAYYKHMVQMIKSGKFKPKMEGLERQNSKCESWLCIKFCSEDRNKPGHIEYDGQYLVSTGYAKH